MGSETKDEENMKGEGRLWLSGKRKGIKVEWGLRVNREDGSKYVIHMYENATVNLSIL